MYHNTHNLCIISLTSQNDSYAKGGYNFSTPIHLARSPFVALRSEKSAWSQETVFFHTDSPPVRMGEPIADAAMVRGPSTLAETASHCTIYPRHRRAGCIHVSSVRVRSNCAASLLR